MANRCVTMIALLLLLTAFVTEIAAKPLAEGQVTVAEKSVAIALPAASPSANDARASVADQVGVESNVAVSKNDMILNIFLYEMLYGYRF